MYSRHDLAHQWPVFLRQESIDEVDDLLLKLDFIRQLLRALLHPMKETILYDGVSEFLVSCNVLGEGFDA